MKKKIFYFAIFMMSVLVTIFSCQKEEWTTATDSLLDEQTALTPDSRCLEGQVFLVEPTGVDDTENLQAAFDSAVALGTPSTVQLIEGEYYLGPLVIEDFNGIFEGAGKDLTTIHSAPDLEIGEWSFTNAPTPSSPWPVLLTFSGGDISMKDMSFQIQEEQPIFSTFGNWAGYEFYAIVLITGEAANSTVENVGFEGVELEGGFLGYNVGNSLLIQGNFTTPWIVSGTHNIHSCSFYKVAVGAAVGLLGDVNLVIGGSASKGNIFDNVYIGVEIADFSNSTVEVSYNQLSNVAFEGLRSMQGYFYESAGYAPEASHITLKRNTLEIDGEAWGVLLSDLCYRNEGPPLMKVDLVYNTINIANEQRGIYSYGLCQANIQYNILRGYADFGMYLSYTGHSRIANNNFDNFDATSADILLMPTAHDNRVVCGKYDAEVLDLGTDNDVVCPLPYISDLVIKEGVIIRMQEHQQLRYPRWSTK